ncbi:MAG: PaaI family thioesterase [Actinomycetota bacterium]|nr:PaaI family thioesterase [Actinomycetota bacterium]
MTNEPGIDSGPDMGALGTKMGMQLVEARPGRVVATMPVEGNTQPYGLLHGGASAVLAESVGSIAAWLHGGPDSAPVGVDLSCTHHRAVRSGTVTAVATPLSEGRTVASYDIRITDEQGRPVCTARLTCLIRAVPAANVETNIP